MQTGRHSAPEKQAKGNKRKQVSVPALIDSESDSDEDGEEEVVKPAFTPVNALHVNGIVVTPGLVFTFQPQNAENSWRLLVLVCSSASKRSVGESTFFLACFFFIVLFFLCSFFALVMLVECTTISCCRFHTAQCACYASGEDYGWAPVAERAREVGDNAWYVRDHKHTCASAPT